MSQRLSKTEIWRFFLRHCFWNFSRGYQIITNEKKYKRKNLIKTKVGGM